MQEITVNRNELSHWTTKVAMPDGSFDSEGGSIVILPDGPKIKL
jgi:hypothetical protein